MRADPVRQALRRGRLGVGVVGGVRDGDEDLRRPDLAGAAVEQIDGLAGMIDEHALAGGMSLARRRREPDCAAHQAQRSGNRPVTGAACVLEAQDLAYTRIDTLSASTGSPARHS